MIQNEENAEHNRQKQQNDLRLLHQLIEQQFELLDDFNRANKKRMSTDVSASNKSASAEIDEIKAQLQKQYNQIRSLAEQYNLCTSRDLSFKPGLQDLQRNVEQLLEPTETEGTVNGTADSPRKKHG